MHLMGWHTGVTSQQEATFAGSKKGWTDQELRLDGKKRNSQEYTKDMYVQPNLCPANADSNSAKGEPQIPILYGHDSYLTWQFFDYCLKYNIHPMCLPSHSTHILQSLDVGLVGPLQHAKSEELDTWMRKGGNSIKKGQFHKYYSINNTITVYRKLTVY